MTKTIKLSLAAALLATSVSAVEFSTSGKMEVEYDQSETKLGTATATTTNEWDMDVDATVKAKFNDNFTGVVTVQGDQVKNVDGSSTTGTGDQNGLDSDINVVKQYVQYTNGGTTALIGKQSIGTPFFDDERGTGVVVMQNLGAVTVAAANFDGNTNSIVSDTHISAQAVIGSTAGVNYSVWLAQVTDVADAYTAELSTKVGPVAVSVRHSEADYEVNAVTTSTAAGTEELTQVALSTEVSGVTLGLAYGETNDKNGNHAGVDLTGDNDAATNFGLDQIDIDGYADAEATVLSASTKLGGATVTLAHLDGDAKVGTVTVDAEETKVSFAYPLAAGAKLTGKYSTAEAKATSSVAGFLGTAATAEKEVVSLAVEFKF